MTTLSDFTDSELEDRAAELRKALAATEAEIAAREKVADWPTAQYVWGEVNGRYLTREPVLWVLDPSDGTYESCNHNGEWADPDRATFTSATPVTLVPTAEWDMLVEAYQAWKDSDYVSVHARSDMEKAVWRVIAAAEEVQG